MWKTFLTIIFSTQFIISCSHIEFTAPVERNFSINAQKNHEKVYEVTNTKDFYFWGITPEIHTFDLDLETKNILVDEISYVNVEQVFSFKNIFMTAITFGLYCPVDYKVTFLSTGKSNEY